jgi:anti-sigma-K factor RskA
MNIREWIDSGIIESYVMGDLSQEETREVEEMAERHPEVKAEIAETEMVLEGLARKAAVKPRSGLKDDLFSRIETTASETKTESASTTNTAQPRVVEIRSNSRTWQWLSAAAIALLIFSTALAFYYRSQWQSAESQLASYIAQEQELSQEYQALRSDFEQLMEQKNQVFTNPNFQQVRLQGTEVAPSAFALVYWNDASDQVYLNPAGLPEPEAGKQYQLWGIVDGQPASAGVFDLQDDLVAMQQIDGASAFAITLEPEGGSENPTLEAMYVLGEV